jgi:cytochrome c5
MRGRALMGAGLALAALLWTLAAAAADTEAAVHLREAPGREVTAAHCALCHSLEYIPANAPAMDRAAWQKTVQKMRERFGAPITDEEAKVILDYLGASYADKS